MKVTQKDTLGGIDLSFFQLGQDGLGDMALNMVCNVLCTPDGQWYAGPNTKEAVAVTEKEAQRIIASYVELSIDTNPILNVDRAE